MRKVKFGLYLPTGDFARARKVAERAEKQGFYSLSINDHLYSPMGERDPQLECFSTLSAIAAITSRIRLAPAVVAMSFRNPALLAKTASTLDCISNGRLILGLGSGWQRTEYDAHGFPVPLHRRAPGSARGWNQRAQGDVDAGRTVLPRTLLLG